MPSPGSRTNTPPLSMAFVAEITILVAMTTISKNHWLLSDQHFNSGGYQPAFLGS